MIYSKITLNNVIFIMIKENINHHQQQSITFIQTKIQTVVKEFRFNTVTFHLFLTNFLVWIFVHIIYFTRQQSWVCLKFFFFAKYQPSITYNYQIWRLIFSSFMFQNTAQFLFNNMALNMLGYSIEKESRTKFIVCFYSGILMGHLLSCCLYDPNFLTLGTSCGTIALLPLEICRYFKLKTLSPLVAKKRKRFLYLNMLVNFILNGLALFHLDMVDWISHVGAILSGVLLMGYFQDMRYINDFIFRNHKYLKYGCLITIILLYIVFAALTFLYLPTINKGEQDLRTMEFTCYH